MTATPELDIVIPAYNEGVNILPVMHAFAEKLSMRFRVLVCVDSPEDNTLEALASMPKGLVHVKFVQNPGRGPHSAVLAGFAASTAPAILVYMADDDFNVDLIAKMLDEHRRGADIVAASRFMPGGHMEGGPFFKALLAKVATFLLFHVGRVPVHDATNAFRLFSRRTIDTIAIESASGFTFSIELMVKAARLGWCVTEVPAQWFERQDKPSRFQVLAWMTDYLRWFFYPFATFYLHRGPETVRRREPPSTSLQESARAEAASM